MEGYISKSRLFYLSLLWVAISTISNANEQFVLKVSVDNLRDSKGVVQFVLYDRDGTIPDEKYQKFYKKNVEKISNHSSTTIFRGLPKGIYAINVLHDENKNGKIDKGVILPIEGIGFSNYNSINILNKPNFKKASFKLDSDMKKSIKIIYK